ncbi:hypothetical protein SPBR_05266 [Sporothrix brasiliensis 5110]|uniref:Short chain type dehydrogenase n=1 Tax=Sporothrix brasiliensis 5110 TaxID=1398154 RepID=A0A0C2IJN7_9PEZI|nr:uncharacterized protein SPBR_05266 [Sporothrix brasiliensis 5110]KIH87140.1 hypothetical protein SPBR_05266 [Sporothrix brasiliensis 5110]
MSAPVALILGAGSNTGQAVARAFAADGYKIALVARSLKEADSADGYLRIRADLADPSSVAGIFAKVKAQLGAPKVVVYNASGGRPPMPPLATTLPEFTTVFNINTTTAYAAAKEAVKAFGEHSVPTGVFIFTGNITNIHPIPTMAPMSASKSATATLIQSYAEWAASSPQAPRGIRFYYADERFADGSAVYGAINGEAHGAMYTALARAPTQGPWLQTFVKGIGYKAF